MRNFNIIIGPNQGTYKKCGSASNDMSGGEWKGFMCEPNATGISLMIKMKGKAKVINLCEVFVFGTGNGCVEQINE